MFFLQRIEVFNLDYNLNNDSECNLILILKERNVPLDRGKEFL